MNFIQACNAIARDFNLDAEALVAYAMEDEIGGFGFFTHWPGGSVWSTEGRILYALVRALRPRHLVEVGTAAGCSATHLLYAIERNGNNDHLSSVDIEAKGHMVPEHLRRWWTMHTGITGQTFLRETQIPFDFAYEDGPHSLEGTQEILEAMKAIPSVRTIVSHDACHPAVGPDIRQAWTNVFGENWKAYLAEPSDCGLAIWVRPNERILYLPLFGPGVTHAVQVANKKGLFDALAEYGSITQLDYMGYQPADLFGKVKELIAELHPTILFTQLHGPGHLTPNQISELRALAPDMTTVNFSGDAWRHSLVSEGMLDLAKRFHLNLTTVPEALPIYAEHGIRAEFFQLAYEKPVGDLPDVPAYDIVFLANAYAESRRRLMAYLRGTRNGSCGIYGDWEHAQGSNTYNFAEGEALYQKARVAIADNVWFEKKAELFQYVSDRPFQVLMAGGAVLFHQHVEQMADLTDGMTAGEHYVEWQGLRDLDEKLAYYLDPAHEDERLQIVRAGRKFALERHTWRRRVSPLMWDWLKDVRGQT